MTDTEARVARAIDKVFSEWSEDSPAFRLALARAAIAAMQSGAWVKTAERLPEKPGLASYEHVDCLIYHKGEIKMRPWNCEHLCWDDADGDDFYCDPTEPTHWMPLPPPPQEKP